MRILESGREGGYMRVLHEVVVVVVVVAQEAIHTRGPHLTSPSTIQRRPTDSCSRNHWRRSPSKANLRCVLLLSRYGDDGLMVMHSAEPSTRSLASLVGLPDAESAISHSQPHTTITQSAGQSLLVALTPATINHRQEHACEICTCEEAHQCAAQRTSVGEREG